MSPTASASISSRAPSPTPTPTTPLIHTGHEPALLAGVLQTDRPERLVQPLDLYARAAPEHPKLARTLTPILTAELQRLCTIAAEQAASATDLELLLGDATVAATLARALDRDHGRRQRTTRRTRRASTARRT